MNIITMINNKMQKAKIIIMMRSNKKNIQFIYQEIFQNILKTFNPNNKIMKLIIIKILIIIIKIMMKFIMKEILMKYKKFPRNLIMVIILIIFNFLKKDFIFMMMDKINKIFILSNKKYNKFFNIFFDSSIIT